MWISGWLLTNWVHLRCINDLIIQWGRHRYHWWWQLIYLWFTYLAIKAQVITRSFFCLPWLFHVPLLWQLPIPFGRGMINSILVCGGIVSLLFCFFMANKRWEPTFLRGNCINVWVSVPGIKLIARLLSQYNSYWDLKYDLSEKGHYFTVHISYFKTKINKFIQICIFDWNTCTANWVPLTGNCDTH